MDLLVTRSSQRLCGAYHDRGAVYVEFLLAFMPLFIIFLAICQFAFLATARIVTSHAAVAAVRSAIVVLEDPGPGYDSAPLGSLSLGTPRVETLSQLTDVLTEGKVTEVKQALTQPGIQKELPQQHGARMGPVRLVAHVPLLALAPDIDALVSKQHSLKRSLQTISLISDFFGALEYTQAATAVTVHASESDDALIKEPLVPGENVTVRVDYLYRCAVPIVRVLMCKKLGKLLSDATSPVSPAMGRIKSDADPELLKLLFGGKERFAVMSGVASLPNQGAVIPE